MTMILQPSAAAGSRWTGVLLLLAWCFLIRAPAFCPSVIDWDESLYVLIADRMRFNELPYQAVWDHKPPGLYLMFYLALQAFGRSVMSARIMVALAVFASAICVTSLARSITRNRRIATWTGFTYPCFTLLWDGTAANCEHLFIAFNLLGALLLMRIHLRKSSAGARLPTLAAAGLLFGCAAQIKYLALFESGFMVAMFLFSTIRERGYAGVLVDAVTMSLALVIPTTAAATYFALHGGWEIFFDANFLANLRHADARDAEPVQFIVAAYASWIVHTAPLWGAAMVIQLASPRANGETRRLTSMQWSLLAWVAVGILESSATKQFYRHYFLVTMPPLCLLLSSAAAKSEWVFASRARSLVLFAGAALPPLLKIAYIFYAPWLANWIHGREDEPARIASLMRRILKAGETVFVVDYEPVIYFLADVKPPTKFAFPPFLMVPHFSKVAQVDYRQEFAKILGQAPRCIVLRDASPSAERTRADDLRDLLGSEYASRGTFKGVEALCRP